MLVSLKNPGIIHFIIILIFRKLSNKRFARAKRIEGNYWFAKGEFEKAIKAFKKALDVNSYHSSTWFTKGCAHLRIKDYQEAAMSFGRVVSIDETQGEAWANMAAALTMSGKKAEAFSALQQAVKHHENNWKIWQNFMMVALESKKFKAFLEGVEKLISLKHVSPSKSIDNLG
jgi:tetratricopeptide (TPR) repeat protein